MIFAIVAYGCFLGWFRFFRVSNLFLAMRSFSSHSPYPVFVGIIYIFLFGLCIILLFQTELLANFVNYSRERNFLGFKLSFLNFSYFSTSVIFGEICRLINTAEGEEDKNDGFLDLLKSLSPDYYIEDSLENILGFETCAAIQVSSWLYGVRSDVKRSLIIAVSKEFNVPRYQRLEVLNCFDLQTGQNRSAKIALKSFVKRFGKGTLANVEFLEKIARIGRRSGFTISDVKNGLHSIGKILEIPEQDIRSALKRAAKTSTDHNWRNFSEEHFWKQNQSYTQKTYAGHDYKQSSSSYYRSSSQSINERQVNLKVLGLADGASDKDIRTAYRKMAMKYHPDRVQADGGRDKDLEIATKKMSVINKAYDWLCDNPA